MKYYLTQEGREFIEEGKKWEAAKKVGKKVIGTVVKHPKKALAAGALAAGAIAGANDPGVVAKTRMALNPASRTAHVGQPDAVGNYFKNLSQASREMVDVPERPPGSAPLAPRKRSGESGESSTSEDPKGMLKGKEYLKFAGKHVEPKLRKAYPGHPSWSWNK